MMRVRIHGPGVSLLVAVAQLLSSGIEADGKPISQEGTRPPPVGRLIPLLEPQQVRPGSGEISPDGKHYAYEVKLPDSSVQIWVQDLENGRARALTEGIGESRDPAWSPESDRIAFSVLGLSEDPREDEGLWVVDLADGSRKRVFQPGEFEFVYDPHWVDDRSILFRYNRDSLDALAGTWIVAADGSDPRSLEHADRFLFRSPDLAKRAYFAGCCNVWHTALWISDLDGDEERCVAGPMESGQSVHWTPDSRNLFFMARLVGIRHTPYGGASWNRVAAAGSSFPTRTWWHSA